MTKRLDITIPDEIAANVSGRIQELIFKGYLHEQKCNSQHNRSERKESVVCGISARDSCLDAWVVEVA